jgi:hypothetical protein
MFTFRHDLFNSVILHETNKETALDDSFFRKSENVISGGYRRGFCRSGTSGVPKGYKLGYKKLKKQKKGG